MIFRHIDSIGELSIEKAASSIGIVGRQGAHPLSSGFRGEGLGGKGLGWGGVCGSIHSIFSPSKSIFAAFGCPCTIGCNSQPACTCVSGRLDTAQASVMIISVYLFCQILFACS